MCVFLYLLNECIPAAAVNSSPHAGMVLLTLVIHLWCVQCTDERRGQQDPQVHVHATQVMNSELCQNKPFLRKVLLSAAASISTKSEGGG